MRDSNSSAKKPIEEVQTQRPRKPKLEPLRPETAERKKEEEELKRSKEFLANVINALDDPVFVKDEEHRWVVLNDAACEVMGRPREELIGKSDYDLFPKEQADVFWKRDNHVLNNGETDINEEEITWHGELHTISTKKSVFTDSLTGKKFIAGTIRDITERKRAEEELKKSKDLLEKTFLSLDSAVLILDSENPPVIMDCNTTACRIFGYEKQEMLSKTTEFLHVSPETLLEFQKILYPAIQKEGHLSFFEFRMKRKNGEIFPTEHSVIPLKDDKGNRIGWVSVVRDITERKKVEETLKIRAQILENMVEGVNVSDDNGVIFFTNPTFDSMFGYEPGELIGKHVSILNDLTPKENRNLVNEIIEQLNTKGSWSGKFTNRRKDGTQLITSAKISTLCISGKNNWISVQQDITERKKADEALRLERDNFINILDSMEDGVYIVDQSYDIQYVNPVLKKDFGPLEGRKCYEYFHSRKEICPWCKNKEVFAGKTVRWEWYSFKNQRTYDLIDTPLRNPDGSISKLEIFRDITERKRAEEERERLFSAIEIAKEGVSIKSSDLIIIYTNAAMDELFGYQRGELLGKHVSTLNAEATADAAVRRIVNAIEKKEYWEGEVDNKRKDGTEFVTYATITAIKDEEGKILEFISTQHDITERKRAEEKLLDYQAQLRSLASELSLAEEHERRRIATELHDRIGQSLVVSKLKLETLRKSASSAELGKALEEVCNSLGQTIAETRSLTSEVHSPLLSLLGFEATVAEWLSKQIEEKYGIATEFEDDGQPKPLDDDIRILLFRDVRELLNNVVRHAYAKKVKVSIRKVGSELQVSVEDDGVGFDPVKVATGSVREGAFGLFSIQERLELSGGHLEIESKHGHGTRITITAPLKQENNDEGK